jgi:hypothetical protein
LRRTCHNVLLLNKKIKYECYGEAASITIPLNKPDVLNIMICLDKLYSIVMLYDHVATQEETDVPNIPILPMEYVEGSKKSLPKSKKPSWDSIN